jgi:hypothetical protein
LVHHGLMYVPYRRECWCWEGVEVLRKLLMTGLVSSVRCVVAVVVSQLS